MASDVRWRSAGHRWYHNRGMSPLLGVVGLAIVFGVLVTLMLSREGRSKTAPQASPDPSARNSLARTR